MIMRVTSVTYDFESQEELINCIKQGKKVYKKYVPSSWGMYTPYQEIKVNMEEKTIEYFYRSGCYSTERVTVPFEKLKFNEYELVKNNA